MGRPRKYATAADKARAYRERYAVGEFRLKWETMATLESVALEFDVSRNEVVNSMINFALTNRDWFKQGLYGKRLPFNEDTRKAPEGAGNGDD